MPNSPSKTVCPDCGKPDCQKIHCGLQSLQFPLPSKDLIEIVLFYTNSPRFRRFMAAYWAWNSSSQKVSAKMRFLTGWLASKDPSTETISDADLTTMAKIMAVHRDKLVRRHTSPTKGNLVDDDVRQVATIVLWWTLATANPEFLLNRRLLKRTMNRMTKAVERESLKLRRAVPMSLSTYERKRARLNKHPKLMDYDEHVALMRDASGDALSPDQAPEAPAHAEDAAQETLGLPELLPDESLRDIAELTEVHELITHLPDAFVGLTALQRDTVNRHFGLGAYLEPQTLTQIAAARDLSPQSVKECLDGALKKLLRVFRPISDPLKPSASTRP